MGQQSEYDIVIIGGGLAGITAALELLDAGLKVLIVDRDTEANFGGLAKASFGGMALVDTPIQRRNKIHDSPEIALRDWHAFAQFSADDIWPKKWAKVYVNRSVDDIYNWLRPKGVKFFPVPHWVERGYNGEGNSLPRYHVIWGTGQHLMTTLVNELRQHPKVNNLTCRFGHTVKKLLTHDNAVCGVQGVMEDGAAEFEINAPIVIVACGGINGDINRVKSEWDKRWGAPPEHILNGAHQFADGTVHDAVSAVGGNVTKLHQMWNYAAGVHHPEPRIDKEGLSLIPPKSALWLDATGRRFNAPSLIAGFDTHEQCKQIAMSEHGYSWQVMNWKIGLKEIAVSGAQSNPAFRDRKVFQLIREILLGNHHLLQYLVDECEDVLIANSLEALVENMNRMNTASQTVGSGEVNLAHLTNAVAAYDEQIDRGETFHNDDQLRRLAQVRHWRGDRSRTCKFQKILDPKAMPLIAIREFIVSRKSMGGIQTDLHSRVLSNSGDVIPGLYAAGEAAGFGGGGISGQRSLEGTFISNCILNARMASRSIREKPLTP